MTFPHHGEGSDAQGTDDANNSGAVGTEEASEGTGGGSGSGNAPWSSYLEDLPETLRPLVEPKFKEWDANVTKKIQSLHSEYEPYKPFVEQYEPEYLDQAAQLMQALETDPEAFMAALQEAYGFGSEQGTADQQEDEEGDEDNTYYDPRIDQQQELLELMAEQMIQEREAQEFQAQDQELDQTLEALKEEHGEFDENYVLTLIANGVSPEEAVGQFNNTVQSYAQKLTEPNSLAPRILGSGGGNGLPSDSIDPSSLSSKDTKKLVADLLARANQEG